MLDLSSQLMIISDLDGSLLDHYNYDWKPAQAWLDQLYKHEVPVVFCTSKTAIEVQSLQQQMQLDWPFICENGATVYIKHEPHVMATQPEYALNYTQICKKISEIQQQGDYQCIGFCNMSAQDVSQYTGLSLHSAGQAKIRLGSEPLLWQDSEQQRVKFTQQLHTMGLEMIQGGRFWHVVNQGANKAFALDYLLKHYTNKNFITVGLGDSPNDLQLLEFTDYSVVIKNHKDQHIELQKQQQVKYTDGYGPTGWAEGLSYFIRY